MGKITWINHAGFLLSHGEVRLIVDPWLGDTVFDDGWKQISATRFEAQDFAEVTHLWLSHEHPDHFSPAALRAIPRDYRRQITVLYQATADRKVREFCEALEFAAFKELPHLEWAELSPSFRLKCGKWYGGDSWFLADIDGKKWLNLNDCYYAKKKHLRELKKNVGGDIDVLLNQFSYGIWLGNPDEKTLRAAESEKCRRLFKAQCETLSAKHVIPSASFFYFCHEDNFYLNDSVVSPAQALAILSGVDTTPVLLYPGDRWKLGQAWKANEQNAERYRDDFIRRLAEGPVARRTTLVTNNEIETAASRFFRRYEKRNSGWKFVPQKSVVIGFFEDTSVRYILRKGRLEREENRPVDIRLSKESFLNCFLYPRGSNTLLVNGKFRLLNPRRKSAFFKYFIPAQLNDRGISLTLFYVVKERLKLILRKVFSFEYLID